MNREQQQHQNKKLQVRHRKAWLMGKVEIKPFELAGSTVGRTVLIVTCDGEGKPNAMTAGWLQLGGLWGKAILTIAVRPDRYTWGLLNERGEFTVNVPGKSLGEAVEVCGTVSGRDEDKFSRCEMTAVPGKAVSVPAIGEALITYECKVVLTAESAPITRHRLYFGEIVSAYADEELVKREQAQ